MYVVNAAGSAEFPAYQSAWNDLVTRTRYPSVFCSAEWFSTWWKHFGAGRELRLFMVHDGNELKGVLPLYMQRQTFGRDAKVGRVLRYCSASDLYPDPLDLICADTDVAACIDAIIAHLQGAGDWDVLHLRFLTENSRLLQRVSQLQGYAARSAQITAAPYISIAGSYESYVGTLSSNERSSVRRRRRKLIEGGGVAYVDLNGEDRQQMLQRLLELHEKRSAEKGIHSSFTGSNIFAFHRDLLGRLDRSQLWLRGLKHGADLIAIFYGYVAGGCVSYYQLGYDPAWAEASPGAVLLQETIREAFDRGMKEYNFLQGEEGFKYRWTRHARALFAVDAFNRSLCGYLSRSLDSAKRRLKARKKNAVAVVAEKT